MTEKHQLRPNDFDHVGVILNLGDTVIAYVNCGTAVANEIANFDYVTAIRDVGDRYRVTLKIEPDDAGMGFARDYFTEHVAHAATLLQQGADNE